MIQLGQSQGLFAEGSTSRVIIKGTRWQNFDRHVAVQLLVVRAIDHTHATGPDFFEDTVVAEHLADHSRSLLALILGGLNPRVNGAYWLLICPPATKTPW